MRTKEYIFNVKCINSAVYYTDEGDKYYVVNSIASTTGNSINEALRKNYEKLGLHFKAVTTKQPNGLYTTSEPIEKIPTDVKIMTLEQLKKLAQKEESYLDVLMDYENNPNKEILGTGITPSVLLLKETSVFYIYEKLYQTMAIALPKKIDFSIEFNSIDDWGLVEKTLEKVVRETGTEIVITDYPS